MKKFKSINCFIEESNLGRHKTFIVKNDMDRTKMVDPWEDMFPEVEIDGKVYKVKQVRGGNRSSNATASLKMSDLIGIEIL